MTSNIVIKLIKSAIKFTLEALLKILSLYEYLTSDGQWRTYPLCSGWIPRDHARSFWLMESIGRGRNLDLPPNAKLLADKSYPDGGSLLTTVRANQMPLLNHRDRRRARRFNTLLFKRRVKVEHVFKEVKTYKVIGQIWPHPRWFMPVCVELVALLSERRVRLLIQNSLEDTAKSNFNSFPQMRTRSILIRTELSIDGHQFWMLKRNQVLFEHVFACT